MRPDRLRSAALVPAALLAGFAVLALLVQLGAVGGLDQFAVDHLMPGLYPYVTRLDRFSLSPALLTSPWNPNRVVNRVEGAVVLLATPVPATLAVAVALLASRRLRRPVWGLGYVLLVAVDLAGKLAIVRPPLHTAAAYGALHIHKFDGSFPSGETERAVFLAGLFAAAWPPLRVPAALWAAAAAVLLVAGGTHTPSDVAGGLLVAGAVVSVCRRAGVARREAVA